MKIEQRLWTQDKGWEVTLPGHFDEAPQMVLVFGARRILEEQRYFDLIHSYYPDSHIIECSTAGEILDTRVRDNSLSVTAIHFEKTTLKFAEIDIEKVDDSLTRGEQLAGMITQEGLVHAMVFSDGLRVNGTALVKGLNNKLPSGVAITGGLVGDGAEFLHTVLGLDHVAKEGKIILVGFYGTSLKVGYGSYGGWDAFGVDRTITKSAGNVLYELDGKPALELYKAYLGDKAAGLPGTGLLFPLRLRLSKDGSEDEVVRTILAVNETDQSMTFAGDMPEGTQVTLMKANFDRLIDGATSAGSLSVQSLESLKPQLAILVSCVGRKLVLKERVEEEIEAVREIVGKDAVITGFYSYGELCPTAAGENQCRLHNQTMTITALYED